MSTITTTLVSGQNAYVGSISSIAEYTVGVTEASPITITAGSGVQGPAGANGASSNTGGFTFANTIATTATGNGASLVLSEGYVELTPNYSNGQTGFQANRLGAIIIYAANTAYIYSDTPNNGYEWKFGADAKLTLPGDISGNTAGFAIGYRDIPQNFTNTSFTLALTDAGKHILTQNSGASTQTITIANNQSVAFQLGAAITIVVQSTGTVAVANGAGVTMYLSGNSTAKSTVTLNSYSMATLLKIGTDTWMVSGTGAA